jgi:TolB-like protein/tetratricopeptide (TPR) repeat protein
MVQDRPIRVERRLSAIMAADVAGYSRLMHNDEEATHAKLAALLTDAVAPAIAEHGGRIVKNTGDGFLAEFPSAVEAVRAAVQFQARIGELAVGDSEDSRIAFRVGINVGDVIVEAHDIFGDGVNIAARLESIAEAGGIWVSSSAYDHVRGKIQAEFLDMGEQSLKNIDRPVRAFRVLDDAMPRKTALSRPDKPSIAVLPFQNLSAEPEQEYLADAIVEDITMALSLFRWLFVIARDSSFTYRGRTVDVTQVGRELGVRYVLVGSVRKAGNRIRIAGQLVDTETRAHLWAGRFEGPLEDMFDLQDRVTEGVVGAIAPKLQIEEIKRANRKPTESLLAYDYYLRGMAKHDPGSMASNHEALRLYRKAIDVDPKLACAYAMAAWCYVQQKARGWMTDIVGETAEATSFAQKAVQLGSDDAVPLCMGAYALAFIAHEFDSAAAFMDRGLKANPNHASGWALGAWLRVWRGEPDLALEHVAHAIRLIPRDPSGMHGAAAYAHFLSGDYDRASSWAETAMRDSPLFLLPIFVYAASNALAARPESARQGIELALKHMPGLRISSLKDLTSFRRGEDFALFSDGLRKAGLPE